jgi:2-polyprenyl-3-methyl-5-hydroxy-6-metoxy-1,4-benzoquinol methylase
LGQAATAYVACESAAIARDLGEANLSTAAVSGSQLSVTQTLESLARRYPAPLIQAQLDGIPRNAFHVELVRRLAPRPNATIADIGGGICVFSPGCAALGMDVTLVDDFGDQVNLSEPGSNALALHRELGVRVEANDATKGLALGRDRFDAITCFDAMEHWHHSPKAVFHSLMESLRPGGWFIVSVPNCVNLRKRISMPLGYGKWSPMSNWYDQPVFRGHVREPDVDDLRYIARDLGLIEVKIFGRNWMGFRHAALRAMMPAVDAVLRLRPSLCANIYLTGRKP